MADVDQQNNLFENCELLGDKVKIVKSALRRPTGINIGLFVNSMHSCFLPKPPSPGNL